MSDQQVVQDNKSIDLPSLKDWGDDAWRAEAACKGMDTNLFFPTKSLSGNRGLPSNVAISKARLICAGCTVRKECLDFAVTNVIQFGMFGGVPPRDRRPNGDRRSKTPKSTDGSMSFKLIVKDLTTVRRHEKNKHPHTFVEELAMITRKSTEEVQEMLDSSEDVFLY